jgi:hypothetical protein
MKKLGKLTISPEKIMKNEELINLQGGYDGSTCAWEGGSGYTGQCNQSKFAVEWWSQQFGGRWCCDSCAQATWYAALCGS